MQTASLKNNPSALYLLSSSEPLLVRDWLDEARKLLREAGFEDIQNHSTEAGFDWQSLVEDGDMLSLFSSKKCRVVNIANGKPGQQGGKVIQTLCENPPQDIVIIFVVPNLDRQSKSSSWHKKLSQAGEVVELSPVYSNQLVDWILHRADLKSLSINRESAEFLAERTEGNLLAADQELEKLSIRFSEQSSIPFDIIEESVGQNSRYTHFLLIDACLAGDTPRAMKILYSLQLEGLATVQLRWALQSTLEQLNALKLAQNKHQLNDRTWQAFRIWRNKQYLYQKAISRMNSSQIERLIQSCATLDRLGKGQLDSEFPGQDWVHIKVLISEFCGLNTFLTSKG